MAALPGKHRVERPPAATADDEGEGKPERQHVILESLALLGAVPVHEEAVLSVDDHDRDQHHSSNAERRHPGQEADGEPKGTQKFGHDGQHGERRRDARFAEERNRRFETHATEPGERILRSMGEHHDCQCHPEDEGNDVAIGLNEPCKHGCTLLPV